MLWTLPPRDDSFPTRWRLIKSHFTRAYLASGGREAAPSNSRQRHAERAIWQRRYWEHLIRDDEDFQRHMDYIHFNPVKHGHTRCPHAWPWSSFARCVRDGVYEQDWGCGCRAGVAGPRPQIAELVAGE